jgi:hypothetical protein
MKIRSGEILLLNKLGSFLISLGVFAISVRVVSLNELL